MQIYNKVYYAINYKRFDIITYKLNLFNDFKKQIEDFKKLSISDSAKYFNLSERYSTLKVNSEKEIKDLKLNIEAKEDSIKENKYIISEKNLELKNKKLELKNTKTKSTIKSGIIVLILIKIGIDFFKSL